MTTYANARGASLERAYRHWRERGAFLELPTPVDDTPTTTVAISRERGSGGGSIAQALAQRLQWPLYDRELVEKIAEDSGVSSELIENLDEKRPNWLTEAFQGFHDGKQMSGVGFAIHLQKVLLALYYHGDCIVLGRGAAQVLPNKRTLRVRIIAPRDYRIQKLLCRGGNVADATREVEKIDGSRTAFVKGYFHKDPGDVHYYDLTIDSSRFDIPACIDLVLRGLDARKHQLQCETKREQ
ncbi:MAG: AAA family ATPase [Aeoliella sp.]